MRMFLTAALAAATLPAFAGAAHAQGYGYLPEPAYAYSGGYEGGHSGRFTLAGARAGITVLGIDLDGSASLKIGLHDRYRGGGGRQVAYAPPPQPVYEPEPAYQGGGYGYGDRYSSGYQTGYVQQQPYPIQYAQGPCCAPPPPPPPPPPCGCYQAGW